ncbi:hypothetical protein GIB67_026677 [Kingdonia uniflora]|uniref:Uncharacterized protein n=1 Tax=Kingdonia uniflora TaxID=39325 RepID=A0A7J7MGI0_9MAGN|nr:hypothetical protein GIB67_026677 [Kingdonia uniflora]
MKYVEFWYSAYVEKVSHLSEEEKYGQVMDFIEKLKDLMSRLYNHYKLEDASIRDVNAFSTQEPIINPAENVSKRLKAKELFRGILKQKDNMDALNDLERDYFFKLLLIGDSGVSKSCLLLSAKLVEKALHGTPVAEIFKK